MREGAATPPLYPAQNHAPPMPSTGRGRLFLSAISYRRYRRYRSGEGE